MNNNYTKEEKAAYFKAQKQEFTGKLDECLTTAFTDEQAMKDLVAHFRIKGLYNYSLCNTAMIYMAGSHNAQSHANWKKTGRWVMSGQQYAEKNDGKRAPYVMIWRPNPYIKEVEKKEKDSEGNDVTVKAEVKRMSFRLERIYDIGQTDGKPLEYMNNSEEKTEYIFEDVLKSIQDAFPMYTFAFKSTGSARGYTDGKTITIGQENNNVDRIKVLIHELGHCLLGHAGKGILEEREVSRGVAELEAESCSLMLDFYFGFDTKFQQAYIENWKHSVETGDSKEVRKTKVLSVVDKIVEAIDHRRASTAYVDKQDEEAVA